MTIRRKPVSHRLRPYNPDVLALLPGTRLGVYEVTEQIGEGGMGQVYRATDTRLKRQVAIKILPPSLAADADRLARFQREAELLASLNHPHIAAIYGLEESRSDGSSSPPTTALVMELVEGEDLSQRIARGAIPLDEALPIAQQIAEALEAAHAQGIIHRDLKPANIKVRADGTVKVLDFGLAKAMDQGSGIADPGSAHLANSPTITSPALTMRGTILGTAAYMSPEQARAKTVDKRADIWAFGCVLYELLTGAQAFAGETVTDVLAAVVKNEPDWTKLPAETPRTVRTVLRRCLTKDAAARLHDIADARIEMQEPDPIPLAASAPIERVASHRGFVASLLAALVIGAAGGALWQASRHAAPPELSGVNLGGPAFGFAARISPDGQLLAFVTTVDGLTQVAVMKPGTGNWTVLTHDRAHGLIDRAAWSVDGSRIYYDRRIDAPGGIYSVPALGGEERLVVEAARAPVALEDGSLLFLRLDSEGQYQLHRLRPGTGELDPLPIRVDLSQRNNIRPLADGRVLVIGEPLAGEDRASALYALALDSGKTTRFAPAVAAADIVSVAVRPDGGEILMAVRSASTYRVLQFAPDGSGEPQSLLSLLSQPEIDVSSGGVLYVSLEEWPGEVLRFGVVGGSVELLATSARISSGAITLADGRTLLATPRAGHDARVLIAAPGKEPTAFADTDEPTRGPLASVGDGQVALLLGVETAPDIAIVAVETGRVLKRLKVPAGIVSLATSPDGKTLYYVAGGSISAQAIDGGEARPFGQGNSITVDPESGDVIVKLDEKNGFKLARIPAGGGAPRPIEMTGKLRLTSRPLSAGAVRQGRLLVPVATADSWFWPPGVLDLKTGRLDKIPLNHSADFHYLSWAADGRVLGTAQGVQSSLWKFAPVLR